MPTIDKSQCILMVFEDAKAVSCRGVQLVHVPLVERKA